MDLQRVAQALDIADVLLATQTEASKSVPCLLSTSLLVSRTEQLPNASLDANRR